MLDAAKARGLSLPPLISFEALPGRGISAATADAELLVGSPRFLAESSIDISPLAADISAAQNRGHTVILLAIDNQLAGAIAIGDTIKPNAPAAIRALSDRGLDPRLITGDNQATAEAIASQVGITRVLGRGAAG